MTTGGLFRQAQFPVASPPSAPGTGYDRWLSGDDDAPYFQQSDGTLLPLINPTFATIKDDIFRISGSADTTKLAAFEVDGFTTGTTRTFTLPNYDATLATIAGIETLTNKTLTAPVIADFTSATHSHQNAAGGGSLDAAAIGSGTLNNSRVNWSSPSAIGTGTPAAGKFTTLTTTSYIEVPEQSAPGAPTNAFRLFADTSNRFSWIGENGYIRTFDGTSNTTDRVYTLPDASGNVILSTSAAFTSPVTITTTTSPQFKTAYDASNYLTVATDANGITTITPTGTGTGANRPVVEVVGILGINAASSTNDNIIQLNSNGPITLTGVSTVQTIHRFSNTITLSTSNQTASVRTANFVMTFNQNGLNATQTLPNGGLNANFANMTISGSSGTVTAAGPVVASLTNSGAGALTNGWGYLLLSTSNSGGGTFTSFGGLIMAAQTAATNNTYVLLGTTTIPSGNWGIYNSSANDNTIAGNVRIGSTTAPTVALDVTGTMQSSVKLVTPIWAPSADSTTALKVTKADASTGVITVDTTNGFVRIGSGTAPTVALDVTGSETISGSLVVNGSVQFNTALTINKSVTTTSTTGVLVGESTNASSGAPVHWSPSVIWRSKAWDTAASQTVDFYAEVQPVSAATPSGSLVFSYQRDAAGGGSVVQVLSLSSTGNLTFADGGNLVFGTSTGTKIGTVGGASGQKLAFYGSTPIVQPLLATGAGNTVDNVITVLQNLGLVRQS